MPFTTHVFAYHKRRMAELRARGLTLTQIAHTLGVSHSTVWNHLQRAHKIPILPIEVVKAKLRERQ